MIKGKQSIDRIMSNRRCRKTEEKILEAFRNLDDFPSVNLIIKKAGISRTTFYRHHESIYKIRPNYEKYILKDFTKMMRSLVSKKDAKISSVYYRMLIYIMVNKKIFSMLVEKGDSKVIEKMVSRLSGKIKDVYHLPKNSAKILEIYGCEIHGIIENWGREGFCEGKMDDTLKDIMYLTETMRTRLLPLES